MTNERLYELFQQCGKQVKPDLDVHYDTSAFMDLETGDVMVLEDRPYLISRNEKEAGYGMDNDPKFWVKRTLDLESGETKIVKLVFFEEFIQKIGGFDVRFFRSPEKEAEILEAVSHHPNFMHGSWTRDSAGNNVRIIDFIRGPSLLKMVSGFDCSYETYFWQKLPSLLTGFIDCLAALSYLHDHDLVHGDVHWNHIMWDRETSLFRWIDFDYAYNFPENPFGADIVGVGNILANLIGQGPIYYHDIRHNKKFADRVDVLVPEDFSILQGNRLMNLKKIFPHIPESLNNILLHFSGYSDVFYESVDEISADLQIAIDELTISPQGVQQDG